MRLHLLIKVNLVIITAAWTYRDRDWSTCTVTCGGGTQSRTQVCLNSDDAIVDTANCAGIAQSETANCNTQNCGKLGVFYGDIFNNNYFAKHRPFNV